MQGGFCTPGGEPRLTINVARFLQERGMETRIAGQRSGGVSEPAPCKKRATKLVCRPRSEAAAALFLTLFFLGGLGKAAR